MFNALIVKPKSPVYPVVVTPNKVFMSFQPLNEFYTVFFVLPEAISKNIYGIVFGYPFVPIMHKNFIHKYSIGKRSVIEANNILMPEMIVCNIINHLFSSPIVALL